MRSALHGWQRWLHVHGVDWPHCVPDGSAARPDGWLVDQELLRTTTTDDPTPWMALATTATGHHHGAQHQPINDADSAAAVPLGALAALWSDDTSTVAQLGLDLAALTHGNPDGNGPAAVTAVAASLLMRGSALVDSINQGLLRWDRHAAQRALRHALALGRNSPAGFMPSRAQIEAMGTGRSGVEVLSIAIRVAVACSDDFTSAVRIAGDHGGDSATSAMVCGQLLGALHGPSVIPLEWLESLPTWHLAEQIAVDAAVEFGPRPDESQRWLERYPDEDPTGPPAPPVNGPGFAAVPRLSAVRDRFLGAVLGGAVGEALGTPIAAANWAEIQNRHGSHGLAEYVPAGHPAGRLGSDTQLLLFSLEGMIRANVGRRREGASHPTRHVQHAYQRWLHTQHLSWARAAGEFLSAAPEPDGWLVGQRPLFQTRNPGRTMMRTLIAFAKGQQPMGSPEHPVSDSQDSDAVLRAVPAALWSTDQNEVFRVAAQTAALTHGAPGGYLSAGALAVLVSRTMHGEHLRTAAEQVLVLLAEHSGHEQITRRVQMAIRFADAGPTLPINLEMNMGKDGTAPEALGIGLHAALASGGDFDLALRTAVNHSGNSATSGAVCGSLMGSLWGTDRIDDRWLRELELCDVVERLAQDALLEFGPRPPRQQDWFDRYPPT